MTKRKKEAADVPQPWERQPTETDEQWLAFQAYRDSGPQRSIVRSATKATATISEWYRRFRWNERTLAYDRHLDTIVREERETLLAQQARDIAADHMALLADAKDFVAREVKKYADMSKETDMPTLPVNAVAKLLEATVKLDRLIRGESTEKVEESSIDLSKLSPEELEQLAALYAKAGK